MIGSSTPLAIGSLAFADDTCVAPADSTYGAGVHHPTGSEASAFTYSCATGLWTSPYYTYDPNTGATSPTYSPKYDYDCAAQKWYKTNYEYDPGAGSYYPSRTITSDPGLPTGCASNPAPAPAAATPASNPTSSSDSNSSPTITDSGPGSTNTATNNTTLDGNAKHTTNAGMNNTISLGSTSGDTSVIDNTTGGSAASGDSQSIANIANLLQSTGSAFGPNTKTFTANINGDVTGDFMFDPAAILGSGPGSNNTASNNLRVNTNTSNDTNAQINNNIDVGANSGNATVASNTTSGDATTGNADAIVNLMNLINSTVAAGQSFIGTVNINGNLDGDILLPQGVLDQLLASTGPGSNNLASTNLSGTSTLTNDTNEAINNAITSSAVTGDAAVRDNTTAGSATSGNAKTNVTLLNLTGSNTVGKNDLLVFVNVLGTWVGMIMNAPTGSNAASLGGGIVSNTGPNSDNTAINNALLADKTTNNANLGINNNVNVHARSGDANIYDNTLAGNARTGNANTAVNILNMQGSNLSLSDWFGVLFINVFGKWNGSFGVNTSAGDPVVPPAASDAGTPPLNTSPERALTNFINRTTPGSGGSGSNSLGDGGGSDTTDDTNSGIATAAKELGAATVASKHKADPAALAALSAPQDSSSHAGYVLPIIGFAVAGTLLLFSERDRVFHRKKTRV